MAESCASSVREAYDWTVAAARHQRLHRRYRVGIKPQDSQKLFEPFFSTKSTKGTGLGLWISKGIVQKYEGRIAFRSFRGSSGSSTCFKVFLPGSGALGMMGGSASDLSSAGIEIGSAGYTAAMQHA